MISYGVMRNASKTRYSRPFNAEDDMNNLEYFKDAFNSVGWFIPPYVGLGFLADLSKKIKDANGSYSQQDLERMLSLIYSPESLAAMVLNRYPITPFIKDYSQIISESVIAHFSNLDHVAVAGLMPVIEGAGTALAKDRSVPCNRVSTRVIFMGLADSCKELSRKHNIGNVGEIVSMMDSFKEYADKYLYIKSSQYSQSDKTNRHGILHGAYTDGDYGTPINFYKAIAAVDFLCFISAFRSAISWFAPDPTDKSKLLAKHYGACLLLSVIKP